MFGWSGSLAGQEQLGPQEICSIIGFMRGTGQKDRDYIYPGSNPGNSIRGREVFAGYCAECHGNEGEGSLAPALNNQEFLSAASNGYLLATISVGREGTAMPSWGMGDDDVKALTPEERKDITAWIRSWQRYRIRN